MDGKVFSKETKNSVVAMVDEAIKLPFWAEPFDGPAAKGLINYIDGQGDKYIPDEFDPVINKAVTLALNGQYEEAAATAGEAADKLIDIELIPDEIEALLFIDGARFIVRFIQNWIEKRKAK